MGNITKSLWHLVTDALNQVAADPADRVPVAQQPGISYLTQWRYVTIAQILALVPPAPPSTIFVDKALTGDGSMGSPVSVLVDNKTVFVDAITNELEAVALVDKALTGDSLNTPVSVLVDSKTVFVDAITNELEALVLVNLGLTGDSLNTPLSVSVDGTTIGIDGANHLHVIAGAGAGGNSIFSTAFGSEPGSPNVGDADLYTNSPLWSRWNGTIWVPRGPSYRYKAPVLGDFTTTVNAPTSVVTTNGGILLTAAGAAGSHIQAKMKAVPSTPYTVRLAFMYQMLDVGNVEPGFFWSDGTKYHDVTICNGNAASIAVKFWSTKDTGGFGSNVVGAQHWMYSPVIWLECSDQGAGGGGNRIVRWSTLGETGTFYQYASFGRSTDFTPTQVGFGVGQENASFSAGIWLLSWEEFTSAAP